MTANTAERWHACVGWISDSYQVSNGGKTGVVIVAQLNR